MSGISKARMIAKLAHKGQLYGDHDYFEFHVQGVVDLCQQNKHCAFGMVELAYLHDVVEDTDITLDDLRLLEIDEWMILQVDRLTRREDETYADYILRVGRGTATAIFVKYHDLRFNLSQCRDQMSSPVCPVKKARAADLTKRYAAAIEKLIAEDTYFLYER